MRRLVFVFVALLFACDRHRAPLPAPIGNPAQNKPFYDAGALVDPSTSPCSDFYAYACGGWMQNTPIPPDEGTWTRSFGAIGRANDEAARAILEADAAQPPADEIASTELGDFYASCLDESAIDALGNARLITLLQEIDTTDALHAAASVALVHSLGASALFVLEPEPDLKDSSRTSAVLRQAPLTLPDSYYAEPASVAGLAEPMKRMFELVGDAPERAAVEAASVIALERALAERFESRAVFHDASATPQIVNGDALSRMAADFPWKSYFATRLIKPPAALHVATPHYLAAMNALFAGGLRSPDGRDRLRSFLRWQILHAFAPTSSSKLAAEDDHVTRLRTGAPEISPRWKRCLRETEFVLGDVLAIAFAQRIDPARIEKAKAMTLAIESATRTEIAALPWMDATTRATALQKIDRLDVEIGDPPSSREPHAVPITRANFSNDAILLRKERANRALRTIGTSTSSPTAWTVTPNAHFDPRRNALVVRLGILAPPIFSEDAALDAAGLGTVLGHEMTHALAGRYDAGGNLVAWWSSETSDAYRQRSGCVQSDLPASMVDELMADEGGLRIAYRALAQARPADGDAKRTRDQAYFTGFAQIWCAKLRPEAMHDFAATNAHPLPSVRVNRSVSEMSEFAAAFSCKPGDPMAPALRCKAW